MESKVRMYLIDLSKQILTSQNHQLSSKKIIEEYQKLLKGFGLTSEWKAEPDYVVQETSYQKERLEMDKKERPDKD